MVQAEGSHRESLPHRYLTAKGWSKTMRTRITGSGSVRALINLRIFITLIIMVDLWYRFVWGYRSGRLQSLLPYTSILRPVMLVRGSSRRARPCVAQPCRLLAALQIARQSSMRAATASFLATVVSARQVLLVFMSFLVVAAAMSIAMIRVGTGEGGASGFADFQSSWITMFTFVCTGEK